jgi:hypothetical protein
MKRALPLLVGAWAACAAAQEPPPVESQDSLPITASTDGGLRWGGEFKVNFRDSKDLQTPIFTPFPRRTPPLFQRTADPGASLEMQTLNLRLEGSPTPGLTLKAEVHVLDLYNRNPTSSDDRIFVREAWLRFGDGPQPAKPGAGKAYVLVGLAPRFTKQLVRHLDSYGLWGTAVGRFEQPQLQAGGSFHHAYARLSFGTGNPVFMRDTNALAGDNGTPDRFPGSPDRVYETGFPILYDAKPTDVDWSGHYEWGSALGARFEKKDSSEAIDVMAWHFQRRMAESVSIRGSHLLGDLDLLKGEGYPLPFSGNHKHETGLNVLASWKQLRFFGQYINQDIAGLGRRGYELELAYIHPLPGLFLIGQAPFLNWVQPVFRYSYIDNLFDGPFRFPSLSILWDWKKYDMGVRAGLVKNVDLTIEYSRHDAEVPNGYVHPDEFLTTFRAGF